MSTWQKFNSFVEALAEKKHDFSSDTFKVVLTNTAPTASNTVLGDITQISATGGYAPATMVISSSSQSGGTYSANNAAVTFTATGAAFDQFRYAVVYNDTSAGDELVVWRDYGLGYTLASGASFTFSAGTLFTLA